MNDVVGICCAQLRLKEHVQEPALISISVSLATMTIHPSKSECDCWDKYLLNSIQNRRERPESNNFLLVPGGRKSESGTMVMQLPMARIHLRNLRGMVLFLYCVSLADNFQF
jgi:hypothetical protein